MIPFQTPQTGFEPLDHHHDIEPGETRRRLARAQHQEEMTLYTHIDLYDPLINDKSARLIEQARIGNQLRRQQPNRVAVLATSIRRSLGALLIATGERIQPPSPQTACEDCHDSVLAT